MTLINRILVTGADGSLGVTLCDVFGTAGFDVIGIGKAGMNPDDMEMVIAQHGPFTHLLNNHGINELMSIGSADYERAGEILLTNTLLPYIAVDMLRATQTDPVRVLSIASQTYRVAQTNTAIYCASKAGLVQLTRAMARELAPFGWVINALAPGKIVDTKMSELTDAQVNKMRGWTEAQADEYALRNIPMRRFTDRNEVAHAALVILDQLPAYVNGSVIDMTGGQ